MSEQQNKRKASKIMGKYVCPVCKSKNVRRVRVINEGGIFAVSSMSADVEMAHEGAGAPANNVHATASGSDAARTAASRGAAPSLKKPGSPRALGICGTCLALFLLVYLVLLLIVGLGGRTEGTFDVLRSIAVLVFIALAVGLFVFARKCAKYYNETSPKQKRGRSYLCNRCGNIFEASSDWSRF